MYSNRVNSNFRNINDQNQPSRCVFASDGEACEGLGFFVCNLNVFVRFVKRNPEFSYLIASCNQ